MTAKEKEEKLCKLCRYYQAEAGNPTWGACRKGSYQSDEGESTSGTSQRIISVTRVKPRDPACEQFEDRRSIPRDQIMKERF